jgi:hypothetical protein
MNPASMNRATIEVWDDRCRASRVEIGEVRLMWHDKCQMGVIGVQGGKAHGHVPG